MAVGLSTTANRRSLFLRVLKRARAAASRAKFTPQEAPACPRSTRAARGEQHFTRHPMGVAGGKKHHRADHILGLSQPAERRSVGQLLDHGTSENADRMRAFRFGGAGSDDVHANVSRAELLRKHA